MIDLRDVNKIYRIGDKDFYALKDINLHINKGEFVSVVGPSGSGKTTLLNIIGCLDTYEKGTYLLNDVNIGRLNDERKSILRNEKIGFILQDFALINSETVLYNVMLPLLFGKTPYRHIKEKAMASLELVGVADQNSKKANQLSGGQRQRVAIARAIVNSPELILADEPTGQLDHHNGSQIMSILQKLNEKNKTVIVVTHDSEIASYASRQINVSDGKVLL